MHRFVLAGATILGIQSLQQIVHGIALAFSGGRLFFAFALLRGVLSLLGFQFLIPSLLQFGQLLLFDDILQDLVQHIVDLLGHAKGEDVLQNPQVLDLGSCPALE